jgi:hypothetical protein
MSNELSAPRDRTTAAAGPDESRAAAEMRLSPRQCVVALLVVAAGFYLIPKAWERLEPLPMGPNYRIPYRLGNDYWQYARACRAAAGGDQTLLVGDSVIWGHYVSTGATLSHNLNELAGHDRFLNLGLDGIHPVAMAGLVESYGGAIRGRRVVVNCNLLWMSSPRHDLSTDKESSFNHPTLVPQFQPWIRCYQASLSQRIGAAVGRQVSFLSWADHVRIAYFDSADLASWTLEHPYGNPLAQLRVGLPSPDEPLSPPPDARPWSVKEIAPFTPDWVPLDESLQWQFFRRTVQLLTDRGNRVFVLVGPFNEHMLTDAGRRSYEELKRQAAQWLTEQQIPHYVPPPLASELYADASHPTADGYAALARGLADQPLFAEFFKR